LPPIHEKIPVAGQQAGPKGARGRSIATTACPDRGAMRRRSDRADCDLSSPQSRHHHHRHPVVGAVHWPRRGRETLRPVPVASGGYTQRCTVIRFPKHSTRRRNAPRTSALNSSRPAHERAVPCRNILPALSSRRRRGDPHYPLNSSSPRLAGHPAHPSQQPGRSPLPCRCFGPPV
jgi:hypothetical protein